MKFRLKVGGHVQNGPDGKPKSYVPGDIVESETDLAERFNTPPMTIKFERLWEEERREASSRKDTHETHGEKKVTVPPSGPPTPPPSNISHPTSPPEKGSAPQPNYEAMSQQDLTELAKEEEVDLRGAKTKADIIARLRTALKH